MSINLHKFPTLQTHKQNEKKPHPLLNDSRKVPANDAPIISPITKLNAVNKIAIITFKHLILQHFSSLLLKQ